MAEPLRLAVVGLVHDHIWGALDHLRADSRATLVAVADDNAPLRRRVIEEYGARNEYTSVDDLLAHESVDAILCGSENNRHAPIVEAAAARVVHVMAEKPMAASYEQARRMRDAAQRAGITLMINWPTAWSRAINQALTLAREGRIGKLFYLKYHAGHNGPRELGCSEYFYSWLFDAEKNGPGALMDYCCYGADLAAYLLGTPQFVACAGGKFVKDYDIPLDNAVILMQYAGSVGIAEASWTQIGHPPYYELVLMGSTGSIVAGHYDDAVILVTPEAQEGQKVHAPELPKGRDNDVAYFISCLLEKTAPSGLVDPEVGLAAQQILEAGARAVKDHTMVPLPL
jgi:predicted dehydrogenase